MKAFRTFIKPFEAPQRVNQLTGFYIRATLALNGLKTLTFKKIFAKLKFSPAFFEKIPSFVCLVLKIENK